MRSLLLPAAITLSATLTRLDPQPEDEDIKAGYFALFLWVGLLVIIGLLGWSMVRHLRTSESNRKAGFYPGNPSEAPAASVAADGPGAADAVGGTGVTGVTKGADPQGPTGTTSPVDRAV